MNASGITAGSATLLPERPLGAAADTTPVEPVVRITGLSKRFPVRRSLRQALLEPRARQYRLALRAVSFAVMPGEFFGLLGVNGAGKTTLFKILSTLVQPDAGSASVEGYDIQRTPGEVRRRLAPVIADERSLLWRLSARENLRLYASLYGLRGRAAERRVTELLATVGLADAGAKLVGQFSSGMKQRLLIARALLPRPRVLLLDEPTRSLDPLAARAFRRLLREEIAHDHGCTVLLATHNAEEAFHLCDRVGVLHAGMLVALGAAADLARAAGAELYRLVTRAPNHPLFAELVREGVVHGCAVTAAREDGWATVELRLGGGVSGAAAVLERLVGAGVPVALFEQVALPLAELIERLVAGGAPHA